MQLLADYFPLLLFFIAFKWQGIYVATAVAMVAAVVQIAWFHWKRGRAEVVHWLSLAIITVFGGATLLLHDDTFIKWKPTVLYGLFGLILAVGKLAFGRNLLAHLMKGITLSESVWTRLTWSWVGFFVFMAVANWYVAFHYAPAACVTSEELPECIQSIWVNFKVWGGIGLFFVFALGQGLVLSRHLGEEAS